MIGNFTTTNDHPQLGMGYVRCEEGVDAAWLAAAPLEVEVAWNRYPARAQLAPWYDPKNERIKA